VGKKKKEVNNCNKLQQLNNSVKIKERRKKSEN
jgi:hypothetical protein